MLIVTGALIGVGLTLIAIRVAVALRPERVGAKTAQSLTLAALGGGVLLTLGIIAGSGVAFPGLFVASLSTKDIEKANADLNRLIEQCNGEFQGVEQQRLAALATVPEIKAALDAHYVALEQAQRTRVAAERHAQEQLQAALEQASDEEHSAKDRADTELQAIDPDDDRATAIAAADNAYRKRLAEIDASVNHSDTKESERKQAKIARDAAIAAAETQYHAARDRANREYQKTYSAAQEKHLLDAQLAWRTEEGAFRSAAAAYEQARSDATATLNTAIRNNGVASSVDEAFATRRSQIAAKCETEKQSIYAQLRDGH